MGSVVNVICKSCGVGWQCMIGCGVLHGNLEMVVDLYPEGIGQEMISHAAQMEFPSYDFGYRLAYCTQCNSIVSVPVLKFSGQDKEYIGTCARCGQEVELAEDVEAMPCPACHEKSFKIEEAGFWD